MLTLELKGPRGEWLLGAESNPRPTASKKMVTSVLQPQETVSPFSSNLNEPGRAHQAPHESTALADSLVSALGDLEQRAQVTPAQFPA